MIFLRCLKSLARFGLFISAGIGSQAWATTYIMTVEGVISNGFHETNHTFDGSLTGQIFELTFFVDDEKGHIFNYGSRITLTNTPQQDSAPTSARFLLGGSELYNITPTNVFDITPSRYSYGTVDLTNYQSDIRDQYFGIGAMGGGETLYSSTGGRTDIGMNAAAGIYNYAGNLFGSPLDFSHEFTYVPSALDAKTNATFSYERREYPDPSSLAELHERFFIADMDVNYVSYRLATPVPESAEIWSMTTGLCVIAIRARKNMRRRKQCGLQS